MGRSRMNYHVFDFRTSVNGCSTLSEDLELFVHFVTRICLREVARMCYMFNSEVSIACVFDGSFRAYLPLATHSSQQILTCGQSIVRDFNNNGPSRGTPGAIMTFDDPALNALNQISQHFFAESSKKKYQKAKIVLWGVSARGYLNHHLESLVKCAASLVSQRAQLYLNCVGSEITHAEIAESLQVCPSWHRFQSQNMMIPLLIHNVPLLEWSLIGSIRSIHALSISAVIRLPNEEEVEEEDTTFPSIIRKNSLENFTKEMSFQLQPSLISPTLVQMSNSDVSFEIIGSVSIFALSQELLYGVPMHVSSSYISEEEYPHLEIMKFENERRVSTSSKSSLRSLCEHLNETSSVAILSSDLNPLTLTLAAAPCRHFWALLPSAESSNNEHSVEQDSGKRLSSSHKEAGSNLCMLKGVLSGDLLLPSMPAINLMTNQNISAKYNNNLNDSSLNLKDGSRIQRNNPLSFSISKLEWENAIGHPTLSFTPLALNGHSFHMTTHNTQQQNKPALPKARSRPTERQHHLSTLNNSNKAAEDEKMSLNSALIAKSVQPKKGKSKRISLKSSEQDARNQETSDELNIIQHLPSSDESLNIEFDLSQISITPEKANIHAHEKNTSSKSVSSENVGAILASLNNFDDQEEVPLQTSNAEYMGISNMGCGASAPVAQSAGPSHKAPAPAGSAAKTSNAVLVVKNEDLIISRGSDPQNDYEFGEKVGEGTFGVVRLLKHKATKTLRAMKIVNKSSTNKDAIQEEIKILAKIDHPNLVRLIEYYEDQFNYFLVFEHYSGGELFDRIKEKGTHSENYAATIIKQVLQALQYLHENKIVHRDLKPENIILESKQPDAPIRVIDFGTASMAAKHSTVVGTPYYIAPEVIKQNYDSKCDIWSVGVILYILLSGRPPFFGDSERKILAAVQVGKYSFRDPVWSTVSEDAKGLIRKLLTYDPAKRPSAAEALTHPWFEKASKNVVSADDAKNALSQVKNFGTNFLLQRAIMSYVSAQLTSAEEKAAMTEVFKALDTNGNGKLSRQELQAGFERHFGKMTSAEMDRIFDAGDIDKSGEIDYSEFLTMTMNKNSLCNAEKLKTTFKTFDIDGSGKISADELAAIFHGENPPPESVDNWKKILADVSGNNTEMDAATFAKLMLEILDQNEKTVTYDEGGF
eukprot:GDKJ01063917.1.p1 GENE.GDKJ01063917.1~~GDKJ01063917.1.p1  ORF type:complete len:1157 (+),score=269.35 GDKJ01063917.1:1-3471(+)